ncbi:hypothetical protein HUT18_11700 [Streptomyces sp. NA04227]|uniref:hypothetical protein n=1 Tax=Streptomyces sp. NA04227 TaxID=2742136 RepID=UPI001591C40D|nr:hypothetical protein [Streptomyces sp. NA04227]QKW06962.1 hypothetical protein HUT18_11700 [Streptomyces sp. NA04227]
MPGQQLSPNEVERLGEATGRIAALAAKALNSTWPHLEVEDLVEQFTRDSALVMIASAYLAGIERGLSPGDAAGEAGTALIREWADSRREARARLDAQRADDASTEPVVVCVCGTSVHDNDEARRGHADTWHSETSPAVWGPPVTRNRAV